MDGKWPKSMPFPNKNALKVPNSGLPRASNHLVRMRSPVQIWVAAPLKPVVPQGISGFYFFFQEEGRTKKRNKKRNIGSETKTGQGGSLLGLSVLLALCFEGIPDGLTGPAYTLIIGVGVHAEGDRRVTMAQALTDRHHVSPVGDCQACGGVAELVQVEVLHPVPLTEFLKVSGGGLRVHDVRAVVLRKNIPADGLIGLFCPELVQQLQHVRANIYRP